MRGRGEPLKLGPQRVTWWDTKKVAQRSAYCVCATSVTYTFPYDKRHEIAAEHARLSALHQCVSARMTP